MPQNICAGAAMMCTFGVAPASLIVLPANRTNIGGAPGANIMDHQPLVNIPTFGMCTSPANPTVASATAAALGVLTPMPCVPNTVTPWAPGSATVKIGYMPALTNACTCNCLWGGVISFTYPGQVQTQSA